MSVYISEKNLLELRFNNIIRLTEQKIFHQVEIYNKNNQHAKYYSIRNMYYKNKDCPVVDGAITFSPNRNINFCKE